MGLKQIYRLTIRHGSLPDRIFKRLVSSATVIRRLIEKKRREKLNFFQYKALSRNLQLDSSGEYYKENYLYGHNGVIKKALGINGPLNGVIEHGIVFGGYVPDRLDHIDQKHSIITFSHKRAIEIKNKHNKGNNYFARNIITVGPYIKYADHLMPEKERKKVVKEYGKILLVFPTHSIEGVNYDYDLKEFINTIKEKASDYDSVFVCMYWQDIQNNKHLAFLDEGYHVVTAGHRNDPYFLRRLKDIIAVSDATMSNEIGTHLGYCICLGKPHYYINQEKKCYGENVDTEFAERQNQLYYENELKERQEIKVAFSKDTKIITTDQIHIVEKYWGKNEIKFYKT